MKHGHYHCHSRQLWCMYSGTIREFRWQNSWHQGPQYCQRFIVKQWISFRGRSKTNGAGCSPKASSFSCSHKCFNQDLQLGDFRPPSLLSWPGAKRLPSLHQDEGLVGYPALPHQRRAHGFNNWLHNLVAPFFDEGLQKLVSQYDKCLNVDGNYVEK